jgi:HK97 gp10 family phage protein
MATFFPRERARLPTVSRLPAGIGRAGNGFESGQVVHGMEGLKRALEELKTGAARSALRKAGRAAGEVIRAEAEARAPEGDTAHWLYRGAKGSRTKYRLLAPGFLKRHVHMKTSYRSKTGILRVRIGPGRDAFYGSQFIELGTSRIPKKPWLVPALVSKRKEAEEIFVQALRAAIAKAVAAGKRR